MMFLDFTWYEDDAYLARYMLRDPKGRGVERLVSRTRGFFVPSETANHRFSIIGDDYTNLFFNRDGDDPDEAVS